MPDISKIRDGDVSYNIKDSYARQKAVAVDTEAVKSINIGKVEYLPNDNNVKLPEYPTTLPASDVYEWAKQPKKPNYTKQEVGLSEVQNVSVDNMAPNFTIASGRENIKSGEKLPVLFGKIMRWLNDLKKVAFSNSYTDLDNKPTALKNPSSLTFTGAVNDSYDGSVPKSIEINIPSIPESLPADGGNSSTVGGYSVGNGYGKIPFVAEDGVMEIGQYLDFHANRNYANDYSTRLLCQDVSGVQVTLPSTSGTLALKSDIEAGVGTAGKADRADKADLADLATKAVQDENGNNIANTYYSKSGGVIKGNVYVYSNVNGGGLYKLYLGGEDTYPYIESTGYLNVVHIGNNDNGIWMRLFKNGGNSDLYPTYPDDMNLGNSTNRWKNVYAKNVIADTIQGTASKASALDVSEAVGSSKIPVFINSSGKPSKCGSSLDVSISGNADTATKATKDGSGNIIENTYLPKSGGSVSGELTVNKRIICNEIDTHYSNGMRIGSQYTNNIAIFYDKIYPYYDGNTHAKNLSDGNGTAVLITAYGGDGGTNSMYVTPSANNNEYLGSSTRKWNCLYAYTSSITNSDKRTKKEISYIGEDSEYDTNISKEKFLELMRRIKPVVFKLKEGQSGRPHHGLIAQDFEELMHEIGLKDHAGFIKSPLVKYIEEEIESKDENGKIIKQKVEKKINVDGEYTYSFRYEELVTDAIKYAQIIDDELQEVKKEVKELKEENKELKNIISELYDKFQN